MGDQQATKADLRDTRDQLSKQIETGFTRIATRLDVLNGRVGKGEVTYGQHDVRLTNLEREIFPRQKRPDSKPQAITERDVRIVMATLSVVAAVALFLWKVLPLIKALSQ